MKKILNFLIVVISSIAITSLISSFLGIAFLLLHIGFWKGFILAFAVQTVGYSLYSRIKDKKTLVEFQKIELAKKANQIIPLTCSFCKQSILVPISLDKENRFTCPNCNESNLVIMQFTVAQVSTPKIAKIDIPIPANVNVSENIQEELEKFLVENSKQKPEIIPNKKTETKKSKEI